MSPERGVVVLAAVLVAGSEKEAANERRRVWHRTAAGNEGGEDIDLSGSSHLGQFAAQIAALGERGIAIRSLRRTGDEATLEITLPRRVLPDEVVVMCAELDDVELLDLAEDHD